MHSYSQLKDLCPFSYIAFMSIVIIAITVFIIFVVSFIYYFKKERSEQKTLFDSITKKRDGIFDIGYIKPGDEIGISSQHSNSLISLKYLSRIYKYLDEQEYWIEFYLENTALEDHTFNIDNVTVTLNNIDIQCDLIVLYEKVPEYMAPPYGNRYYDTRYYMNYMLGPQAQKSFIFQARFKPNDAIPVFKESDQVKIDLSFKKFDLSTNEYIELSDLKLQTVFKYSKYKKIQSVDDIIQILGDLS